VSDLVAIRSAIIAPFQAVADEIGVGALQFQAAPQTTGPADLPIVRVEMVLPQRSLVGAAGDRVVEQSGSLVLSWLFPRSTGMADALAAIEATVAIYSQQTLATGVELTGDATAERRGVDPTGRLRWDVVVPWRTIKTETGFAGATQTALPTLASALSAVRSTWLTQVEQPEAGASWPGLRTFYDDVPVLQAPPPLPWCGYWVAPTAFGSQEINSSVQTVLGRGLVQVHAGPLAICDRIVTQHNRQVRGVQFGLVQVERQSVTAAGTFQTNLRVPFQFQRLRVP
jgi:hypothetical protein